MWSGLCHWAFVKHLQLLKDPLSLKHIWLRVDIKASLKEENLQCEGLCMSRRKQYIGLFLTFKDTGPFKFHSLRISPPPMTLRTNLVYFGERNMGSEKENIYWLTFLILPTGSEHQTPLEWNHISYGCQTKGSPPWKNPFCKGYLTTGCPTRQFGKYSGGKYKSQKSVILQRPQSQISGLNVKE